MNYKQSSCPWYPNKPRNESNKSNTPEEYFNPKTIPNHRIIRLKQYRDQNYDRVYVFRTKITRKVESLKNCTSPAELEDANPRLLKLLTLIPLCIKQHLAQLTTL